ncbi:MAG TPA: hypothetical protein PKC40_10905 [Saprospiraceae bacterium]|nr:hypothetical protein [Saprospiraceae bacterium]
MFTINIYLRFALIGLFLGGGILLAFLYGFWYASVPILIGLILVAGYIFLGTISSAAQLVQDTKLDEAEKRLDMTLKPEWLYASNRAFYYIMKGTFAINRKNTEEGETWLKKAREVKVPTDNERAMIELQLANIAASKGKWNQAQIHLKVIKDLNITESMIKEQVKQFEKAFANRGQAKAAMMMGKQGGHIGMGGGKRRRPKMR